MFILASALLAMHSIYIGQQLWPAAAPLIIHMRVRLGGVAIVYYYPQPAFVPAGRRDFKYFRHVLLNGAGFEGMCQ